MRLRLIYGEDWHFTYYAANVTCVTLRLPRDVTLEYRRADFYGDEKIVGIHAVLPFGWWLRLRAARAARWWRLKASALWLWIKEG